MSTGKVVLGIIAGVAAGSILGFLFAPDKGKRTIRKVSRTREDYVDNLNDKLNALIESVTEKIDNAKYEGRALVENGKSKSKELMNESKPILNNHQLS